MENVAKCFYLSLSPSLLQKNVRLMASEPVKDVHEYYLHARQMGEQLIKASKITGVKPLITILYKKITGVKIWTSDDEDGDEDSAMQGRLRDGLSHG